MRILITGGAGFIGSHTAQLLLERGDQVVILDNFSTSSKDNFLTAFPLHPSPFTLIEGDTKDPEAVKKALDGVDAVIHMASLISVEESVKMPLKYMENNVISTTILLEAMKETGVKKVVFSSSATVYGEATHFPITEDAPLSAANPYGASKIAVEAIMEAYSKTAGFDVLILRYFNPYGPGENHLPETHAVPNFIKAGIQRRAIPLYWQGEQIRDFIYIKDLAQAHIDVLPLKGYHVFNVGTNTGTKISDVVATLSDIFGYSLEIDDKGERPGDVMTTYASSQKLEKATGWKAKVSLAQGLKETVKFFKDQHNP